MKKNILSNLLEQSYQAGKDFVAGLSDEDRETDGSLETWTAKDMFAHIEHWKKYHADNLLGALEGKTPPQIEDGDHANEQVYYQYREQPWAEIEALMKSSYEQMKKALSAFGEDELERSDRFSWQNERPLWRIMVGNIYMHPVIHLAEWYGKKGELSRVAEMYQEMTRLTSDLDDGPDWQSTIRYNNACSYSLLGEKEKAIQLLGEALELNPDFKEWSKRDPDLDPIREEAGYKALYES